MIILIDSIIYPISLYEYYLKPKKTLFFYVKNISVEEMEKDLIKELSKK